MADLTTIVSDHLWEILKAVHLTNQVDIDEHNLPNWFNFKHMFVYPEIDRSAFACACAQVMDTYDERPVVCTHTIGDTILVFVAPESACRFVVTPYRPKDDSDGNETETEETTETAPLQPATEPPV